MPTHSILQVELDSDLGRRVFGRPASSSHDNWREGGSEGEREGGREGKGASGCQKAQEQLTLTGELLLDSCALASL